MNDSKVTEIKLSRKEKTKFIASPERLQELEHQKYQRALDFQCFDSECTCKESPKFDDIQDRYLTTYRHCPISSPFNQKACLKITLDTWTGKYLYLCESKWCHSRISMDNTWTRNKWFRELGQFLLGKQEITEEMRNNWGYKSKKFNIVDFVHYDDNRVMALKANERGESSYCFGHMKGETFIADMKGPSVYWEPEISWNTWKEGLAHLATRLLAKCTRDTSSAINKIKLPSYEDYLTQIETLYDSTGSAVLTMEQILYLMPESRRQVFSAVAFKTSVEYYNYNPIRYAVLDLEASGILRRFRNSNGEWEFRFRDWVIDVLKSLREIKRDEIKPILTNEQIHELLNDCENNLVGVNSSLESISIPSG